MKINDSLLINLTVFLNHFLITVGERLTQEARYHQAIPDLSDLSEIITFLFLQCLLNSSEIHSHVDFSDLLICQYLPTTCVWLWLSFHWTSSPFILISLFNCLPCGLCNPLSFPDLSHQFYIAGNALCFIFTSACPSQCDHEVTAVIGHHWFLPCLTTCKVLLWESLYQNPWNLQQSHSVCDACPSCDKSLKEYTGEAEKEAANLDIPCAASLGQE